MSKYVNRDDVVVAFGQSLNNMFSREGGERIAMSLIKGVPTIDAIPSADRPKGEWMSPTADSYIQATNFYKCSICGKIVNLLQMHNYKYCPNCGAKMKGVDDE